MKTWLSLVWQIAWLVISSLIFPVLNVTVHNISTIYIYTDWVLFNDSMLDRMSTSVLKKLIDSTAESNISMRRQIKEQQMSLLRLEQRVKQKKLAGNGPRQNQLKIPPGKMVRFTSTVIRLVKSVVHF